MLEPHAEVQAGCRVLPNTRKVSMRCAGNMGWLHPLYSRGQTCYEVRWGNIRLSQCSVQLPLTGTQAQERRVG